MKLNALHFSKKIGLLISFCCLLIASSSIAQVTATEDFEDEAGANTNTFSQSGITFNTTFLRTVGSSSTSNGANNSHYFLDGNAGPTGSPYFGSNSQTIGTITIQNASTAFKINSFAAYVASDFLGNSQTSGNVTFVGNLAAGGTATETVNITATGTGNGVRNGITFTGGLANQYITTLTITLSSSLKYLELDDLNFTTQPVVTNQISINDVNLTEGNSGTKAFNFTVTRTSSSTATTVNYATANGTASAGSDYTATSGTLTFPSGGTLTQTITVLVNGDVTVEGDETFFVNLSAPTGGVILDGQGVGTILEDDEVAETFEDETANTHTFSQSGFHFSSSGDLLVSQGANLGAGGSSYALDTRVGNGASSGNVGSFAITDAGTSFNITKVDVYTSSNDGTSGTTTPVNVTFTGTKADGSGTITYVATIPTISGFNYQTVNFGGTTLANVPLISISITLGSGINYIALDNLKYGTGVIGGTQVSINDVSVLEGTGGGTTTALFTVSRSNNTSAFTVNLASSDGTATAGSDYTAYSSTLSFTNGGALSQTVAVNILRDGTIEPNETFNMTLSGATNGVLYLKPVGVGTILDDDKVIETFEDETLNATTFSESSITFSASGRLKVNITQNSGSGSSSGYLTSGPNSTGGVVGKISITSPNKAFKLLQLDAWTGNGNPNLNFASGPVTFTGTLYGGGTVTTTKTITPTNNTGSGWQQNITFTGTPLDNALLTDLEFSAGGTLTTVDIDNINYVAVNTLPVIEVTDASNVAVPNGSAASVANNTDFGTACTGASVSKTYTIKNTGGGPLTLSGSPHAALGGADLAQFSIITQPAATVAANSSTTFTVSYTPTTAVTHNANITIPNNDATNSPYVINIKGTGSATATPTITLTQPTCTVATGTITVNSPTGAGITYSINGTTYQAGNVFNNLSPANYNVTAKNSSSCISSVVPVTINSAPVAPAAPTVSVTQPTCSTPTGTITVNSPTGAGITYSINGTTYQAGNVFNNLAPANYNVTAKNSSACVSSATPVTINAPPSSPAAPTVTVTQPTCSTPAGTITVNSPTGAGITYSINGTTYQSGNVFNNLAPANYNVTAKNSSACVSSATPVTINVAPSSPAAPTVTVTQPTCSTPTGTITVNTPTGAGITYSIDGTNYQPSNLFNNLAPANYNVTAKNSSACVSSATPVTINVAPSSPAAPTVTVTQPTCSTPTGTITVNTPTGAGITYSIDGTNYQPSNLFNNLAPANYNVTAKNSSACVSSATPVTINVAPSSPAAPTVTVTQPTCSTPTGTITVNTPTGAGITYSIDGTNYQPSNLFNNLAPANYNVTAKNSSACVSSATPVTINVAPSSPAAPTVTVTQPTCSTPTGTITVNTPTGAGITYSIDGTNYQPSNLFNNLAPANYNVTAKNSSACVSSATPVTINVAPSSPAAPTVTVTQPTCSTPTGTITVNTPTGAGITYSIDGTNYQPSNLFNNLAPANYNVTAKNSSACVSSATPVTINVAPSSPAAPTVTVTQPTCSTPTGTITVNTPTGAGITYSIDGTNYQPSNLFNNLAPANYNVTAKNSSACVSSATPVTINAQPATPATPAVTVTQPTCSTPTGTITVNTPTGAGITYSIDGTNYQPSNLFDNLAPANYNVTAKNSSACVSSATPVTINVAPSSPAAPTVTVTQPTCSTPAGTITVNSPTGAGITYSINGTTYQSGNVFNNLAPANYNVTAKNSSACVSSATPVTINVAPSSPAAPTVTVTQPTCSTPAGTITVNSPTGAGITYSINGTTYQSGNVFNNLAPANYNVTAKNSSACVSSATPVTIANTTQKPKLTSTINNVTIVSNNDGVDDQGSFTVANTTNNIVFGPFTDQNGATGPMVKAYQVVLLTNATTTMCTNCSAPLTDFNGAVHTVSLVNANSNGSMVIRYREFIDANNNGQIDAGECFGDQVVYTVTINAVSTPCDNDITPPVLISKNATISSDGSGNASIVPADVIASLTDNCAVDPSKTTVSPSQFSCSTGTGDGAIHQAYVVPAATTQGTQAYSGELGMEFKVNDPNGIVVTQLGAFDDKGDGLNGTLNGGGIHVGIFNKSTQQVVPGLDVIIVSSDALVNKYRFRHVTPVTLPVGDYVIVAKGYNANERNGNNYPAYGSQIATGDLDGGAISYTGTSRYGTNTDPSSFNYPSNSDAGPANQYQAGTFSYTKGNRYTVTISAQDTHGNMTTATATVTVVCDGTGGNQCTNDVTPPVLISKNATISSDGSGNASIVPADVIASLTDNCAVDPSKTTVSPSQFSCSTGTGDGAIHQAYVVPAATTQGTQAYSGELGMEFKVNDPNGIVVTQLGAFDDKGDGLNGTLNGGGIHVGIFNKSTQQVVPGLDVIIVSSDALVNKYRFRHVTPVTLPVGDYVIVAKGYNANERNGNNYPAYGSQIATGDLDGGAISYTGTSRYGTNTDPSSFNYPSNSDAGPANQYQAGTFSYTKGNRYTVTISAQDTHGNMTTATATVTVVCDGTGGNQCTNDVTPPVLISKNATISSDGSGNASIVPADVIASLTDNCAVDPSKTTVSPSQFSCSTGTGDGAIHQAYVVPAATTQGTQAYSGELGMEFKVNDPNGIVVTQLGAFDDKGDGLNGTLNGGGIHVGIFNKSTQQVVPGLDVIIVSSDALVNKYRFRHVTPVTLPVGDYVIVAKGYNANERNGNNYPAYGSQIATGDLDGGAISYTGTSRYGTNTDPSSFNYPSNSDAGPANQYQAGTFSYTKGNRYTVTISAQDTHGNMTTATATVTVVCDGQTTLTSPSIVEEKITEIQNKGSLEMKVYPNPSNGQFTIQLLNVKVPQATLQVLDLNGKMIEQKVIGLTGKTASFNIPVDIKNQPSGVYLIKVISAEGIKTSKVVIAR